MPTRPLWQKLLVLTGSLVGAASLSYGSQVYFSDHFTTAFGILAVAVSGVFGGAVFGVLAALLFGWGVNYSLISPGNVFPFDDATSIGRFGIFLAVSSLVVAILHRLQRYAAALEQKESALLKARKAQETEALARRDAESHLTREANRFETVLTGLLDAVISVDLGGAIRYVNNAAETILGYPRVECLGRQISDVLSLRAVATDEAVEPLALTSLRERVPIRETDARVVVNKDGEHIRVEPSAAPLYGERSEIIGAVTILRDVREKHAAEDRLRDHEQRFRLATEAAKIGVWVWNPATDTALWNRVLTQLAGFGDFEYEGKWSALYDHVHPEDRQELENALNAALADKKFLHCEFRILAPSGEITWLASTGPASLTSAPAKCEALAA
ncbi:MAG: PAS domain S-box protein [Bryobacterales bacterium]|nr:PAS domain S-box protein [Bryobacterales bacterium]